MRPYFYAAIFVAFIMFSAFAFAAPVSIEVHPQEIESDVDMNNIFRVGITNLQDKTDLFKVDVDGPYYYWITNPVRLVEVGPGETKFFNLTIFPIGDRFGRFYYTINTYSYENPAVSDMEDFYLDVEPLRVGGLSAAKSGNSVNVELWADSLKRRDVAFSLSVAESDGNVVGGTAFNSQVEGNQTIHGSIALPQNILSGDYVVNAEAITQNTVIKKSIPFSIQTVHNVVRTRAEVETSTYKEITITVKNMGNSVENNYRIVETAQPGQLTSFVTAPNECSSSAGSSSCSYVINGLAPGATARVVYRIEYWPTLLQYFGAAVAVLALLGFTFVHKTKPSISKTAVSQGDGGHKIILEVKNPFVHHMKDVVVRDFIHPVSNIVHEEIESVKPVIRKTELGTEMIWKLGDMKPRETRFLKYGVKTVFQGGALSSPKAYIRFMNPKGKSFRIYSNSIGE